MVAKRFFSDEEIQKINEGYKTHTIMQLCKIFHTSADKIILYLDEPRLKKKRKPFKHKKHKED